MTCWPTRGYSTNFWTTRIPTERAHRSGVLAQWEILEREVWAPSPKASPPTPSMAKGILASLLSAGLAAGLVHSAPRFGAVSGIRHTSRSVLSRLRCSHAPSAQPTMETGVDKLMQQTGGEADGRGTLVGVFDTGCDLAGDTHNAHTPSTPYTPYTHHAYTLQPPACSRRVMASPSSSTSWTARAAAT